MGRFHSNALELGLVHRHCSVQTLVCVFCEATEKLLHRYTSRRSWKKMGSKIHNFLSSVIFSPCIPTNVLKALSLPLRGMFDGAHRTMAVASLGLW